MITHLRRGAAAVCLAAALTASLPARAAGDASPNPPADVPPGALLLRTLPPAVPVSRDLWQSRPQMPLLPLRDVVSSRPFYPWRSNRLASANLVAVTMAGDADLDGVLTYADYIAWRSKRGVPATYRFDASSPWGDPRQVGTP